MKRVVGIVMLALAACSDGPTLTVDVVTDYEPGTEFTRIEARASRGDESERSLDVGSEDRDRVFRGVRVLSLDSLAEGTISVDVELLRGESEIASRRLDMTIRGDSAITVVLSRRCDDVDCEDECHGEACVASSCSSLDRASCGQPQCRRVSDCAPSVDCAVTRCVEGVCLEELDDTQCGDGSCERDLGCTTDPPDGGVDAAEDTGMDAPEDAPLDAPEDGVVDAPIDVLIDTFVPCEEDCDDGDECTNHDECGEDGICRGDLVDCSSMDSTCRVGICSPITGCERVPRPDGTSCNDAGTQRCCGGSCTVIASSNRNCGGCGLECLGSTSCTFGRCACRGFERACASGYSCNLLGQCTCDSGDSCAPGQTCDDVFGGPLCSYP